MKDDKEDLEDEADFDLLEERLLNYPALAIAQCHRVMNGMSKKLRKNVNRAMNLLNDYQQDKYDKVQRKEDLIDKYESRLGEYLIQLTKREMNTAQTTQVSLYLHTMTLSVSVIMLLTLLICPMKCMITIRIFHRKPGMS